MKRLFIILSFFVLSISAPSAEEAKGAKSPPAAPLPSWTGFYAGVNAGGLWNSLSAPMSPDWSRMTMPNNFASPSAFASHPQANFTWQNTAAFLGGGQVGYNLQLTDKVVVGIETDFQGVAGGGSNWNSGWTGAASNHAPGAIGSVRGRSGFLITPNLQVYGTGGLTYGAGN